MGTNKNKFSKLKPPPVPPRPPNLPPSKYSPAQHSSMPDILAGLRKEHFIRPRDPKYDLYDIPLDSTIRRNRGFSLYEPLYVKSPFAAKADSPPKKKSLGRTESKIKASFSRAKKPPVSRTSWYVEYDIPIGDEPPRPPVCVFNNENRVNNVYSSLDKLNSPRQQLPKDRKRLLKFASMASLQGLPPLPKSLSDGTLIPSAVSDHLNAASDRLNPTTDRLSPASDRLNSGDNLSSTNHRLNSVDDRLNPTLVERRVSNSSSSSSSGSVRHPKHPPPPPPSNGGRITPSSTLQNDGLSEPPHPSVPPPPPPPRKPSSLDIKLAVLRREMYELRQMDLSLLSQLWSLNESICEFRQMQQLSVSSNSAPMSTPSSDEDEIDAIYSGAAVTPTSRMNGNVKKLENSTNSVYSSSSSTS